MEQQAGVRRMFRARDCIYAGCGLQAELLLAVHKNTDVLLGPEMTPLCRDHWLHDLRNAVMLMLNEGEVYGVGLMLP